MAGSYRLVLLLILLVFSVKSVAGEPMDTSQGIFHPSFRTLKVTLEGDEFAPPVLTLRDRNSHVTVSFDEIADDRRFMRYELVHCDALWRPEGLVASEFLDGFNEGVVEDYDFSRATLVHYVHYTISIPNREVRITQAGNYLLRVYDESDPDETLLQARFGVSDFSARVMADVSSRTDIDANVSHQQLGVTVDLKHVDGVEDPFNDLVVVISQNGRTDNEVVLRNPQRVLGERVIYEHLTPLIFRAGNEYRRFETVSTSYPGMGVESIGYDAPIYNMWLYTDFPRARVPYSYDSTQHGRFFVRGESSRPDTEADYVMTHFSLEMPEVVGGDVFIDGDLTQRRFDPSSRMVYNRATGRYEHSMLLKQGAYNYQYLCVPFGSGKGDVAPVDGDFYQTTNEYMVKVYHRPRGSRFDRLIGVTMVTSGV